MHHQINTSSSFVSNREDAPSNNWQSKFELPNRGDILSQGLTDRIEKAVLKSKEVLGRVRGIPKSEEFDSITSHRSFSTNVDQISSKMQYQDKIQPNNVSLNLIGYSNYASPKSGDSHLYASNHQLSSLFTSQRSVNEYSTEKMQSPSHYSSQILTKDELNRTAVAGSNLNFELSDPIKLVSPTKPTNYHILASNYSKQVFPVLPSGADIAGDKKKLDFETKVHIEAKKELESQRQSTKLLTNYKTNTVDAKSDIKNSDLFEIRASNLSALDQSKLIVDNIFKKIFPTREEFNLELVKKRSSNNFTQSAHVFQHESTLNNERIIPQHHSSTLLQYQEKHFSNGDLKLNEILDKVFCNHAPNASHQKVFSNTVSSSNFYNSNQEHNQRNPVNCSSIENTIQTHTNLENHRESTFEKIAARTPIDDKKKIDIEFNIKKNTLAPSGSFTVPSNSTSNAIENTQNFLEQMNGAIEKTILTRHKNSHEVISKSFPATTLNSKDAGLKFSEQSQSTSKNTFETSVAEHNATSMANLTNFSIEKFEKKINKDFENDQKRNKKLIFDRSEQLLTHFQADDFVSPTKKNEEKKINIQSKNSSPSKDYVNNSNITQINYQSTKTIMSEQTHLTNKNYPDLPFQDSIINRFGWENFHFEGEKNSQGEKEGFGTLTFSPDNQIVYEGEWKKNMFHGRGVLKLDFLKPQESNVNYKDLSDFWNYASKYEGDMSLGNANGIGSIYFVSGQKYSGQVENNIINGLGTFLECEMGQKITGEWNNNKLINIYK